MARRVPPLSSPAMMRRGLSGKSPEPRGAHAPITFAELHEAIRGRKRAYYGARCCWWTTDPVDLGEVPGGGLPCCPYCGSVLMEADAADFVDQAAEGPVHYGPGGLDTFAKAHHGSGLHGVGWDALKPAPVRYPRRPRMLAPEKSIRCVRCRSEFSEVEIEGHDACPKCQATGLPMAIKDDVTIRINWHELRILGMWADNWAGICDKQEHGQDGKGTIAGILRAISAQHPGRAPLTIGGELEQLQESYPEMTATDNLGNVIVKPKKPN
jgi:hypothetical protein